MWQCYTAFSPSWPPAGGIGLVFLVAMLVLAVSSISSYGQRSLNPILVDAAYWLNEGPAGKFFLGAFIATYLIFVRPAIFSFFPSAFLIEWLVFCLVSWGIFAGIRNFLKNRYSRVLPESDWQRHVQEVNYLADEDFVKLVMLQKDYVENGERHRLLEYLKTILTRNGFYGDQIGGTLNPIARQKDIQAPWYLFGFSDGRCARLNRQNRRDSLRETMIRVVALALPFR